MNGNVSVFNVYSVSMTLFLNGMPIAAGDIPDWTANGGGQRYRPNAAVVPRTLNASDSPGKFFNGNNSVTLEWMGGQSVAQIPIDGSMLPLNQDLLLFVTLNVWQLVNEFGVQISTGNVFEAGQLRDMLAGTDS